MPALAAGARGRSAVDDPRTPRRGSRAATGPYDAAMAAQDDPFAPLFDSDLAGQVRESFEEMLDFGASVTAATQETVHRFEGALRDGRDGPVVILALAALQVRHRQVHASIRDAALELLRDGHADRLISPEPAARKTVRAILADLREVLEQLDVEDDEADEDDRGCEDGDDERD